VRSLIFMAITPNLSMKVWRDSPSSCLRFRRDSNEVSCRRLVSNWVVKVAVRVLKESMVYGGKLMNHSNADPLSAKKRFAQHRKG